MVPLGPRLGCIPFRRLLTCLGTLRAVRPPPYNLNRRYVICVRVEKAIRQRVRSCPRSMNTPGALMSVPGRFTWRCHRARAPGRCAVLPPSPKTCTSCGGLAQGVRGHDGGHGVHRGVLDPAVSNPRSRRDRSVPGQRAALQKSARAQEGREGLPMAPAPTRGGIVAEQLPAGGRGLCGAHDSALVRGASR